MATKLKMLREKKAQLESERIDIAKQIAAITEKCEEEQRGMSDDEKTRREELIQQHTRFEQSLTAVEDQLRAAEAESTSQSIREANREESERRERDRQSAEYRRKTKNEPEPPTQLDIELGFRCWLLRGECRREWRDAAKRSGFNRSTVEVRYDYGVGLDGRRFRRPKTIAEANAQARERAELRKAIARGDINDADKRALSGLQANAASGGATVPDAMMHAITVAELAWGGMQSVAETLTTAGGNPIPWPLNDDTGNDAVPIAENAAVGETDPSFTSVTIGAHKYTSNAVRVPTEFIEDSILDAGAFIAEIFGQRFGRGLNKDYTTGNAADRARGCLIDAFDSGVVTAANSKFDWSEILRLKHAVDPAYRQRNPVFMGHDQTHLWMKQMVDAQGRPLWLPSLVPGEPATFDGDPFVVNQAMPYGASAKALMYGDFSNFKIREVGSYRFKRLDELYALNDQVAFVAHRRVDSKLIDAGTHPVAYLTVAV